jgi:modulator of FtsH protease
VAAYDPAEWANFALAQLGASSVLLGLVFVGVSINLGEIVGSPQLVRRAGEAVLVLGSVLAASTLVLIPDQTRGAVALEVLAVAAGTFVAVVYAQRGARAAVVKRGERGPTRSSYVARRVVSFGAAGLTAVAGLALAAEVGGGLYWWPAAILVAYAGALANAWVLLVEIMR